MTPEGKELAKVTKWLRLNNLASIRLALQPGVASGWPDLLVLLPGGVALFVEMKAPGKKPRPNQVPRLELLDDLGFASNWFDNAAAAIAWIGDAVRLLNHVFENKAGDAEIPDMGTPAIHEPSSGFSSDPPLSRTSLETWWSQNEHHFGSVLPADGGGQGSDDAGDRPAPGGPTDVA